MNKEAKRKAVQALCPAIKREVKYSIPESLVNPCFLGTLPKGLQEGKALAFLYYVVGNIVEQNRERWKPRYWNQQRIVAFDSRMLMGFFGNKYAGYMEWLCRQGIIKKVQKPIAGVQHNGYSINPKLLNDSLKSAEITEPSVVASILRWRKAEHGKIAAAFNADAESLYWLTTGKLNIDARGAYEYLMKWRDRSFAKAVTSKVAMRAVQQDIERTGEQLLTLINEELPRRVALGIDTIDKIRVHEFNPSIDTKRWRQYNTLTQMLSPLRNFLTYDNKPLVDIDLKNSHPLHLCYILTEEFWGGQALSCSLKAIAPELFGYFNNDKVFPKKLLLKRARQIVRNNSEDIKQFRDLAQSGELYASIHERYRMRFPKWHGTLKASKFRINEFINFDSNKFQAGLEKSKGRGWTDYLKFRDEFPNVCFVMETLKQRNYSDISTVLQRMEAKMIKQYAVSKFSLLYPKTPILPIHDGLITLEEQGTAIRSILENLYKEKMGLSVEVKMQLLSAENAIKNLDDHQDSKHDRWLHTRAIDSTAFNAYLERYASGRKKYLQFNV